MLLRVTKRLLSASCDVRQIPAAPDRRAAWYRFQVSGSATGAKNRPYGVGSSSGGGQMRSVVLNLPITIGSTAARGAADANPQIRGNNTKCRTVRVWRPEDQGVVGGRVRRVENIVRSRSVSFGNDCRIQCVNRGVGSRRAMKRKATNVAQVPCLRCGTAGSSAEHTRARSILYADVKPSPANERVSKP